MEGQWHVWFLGKLHLSETNKADLQESTACNVLALRKRVGEWEAKTKDPAG